jgi:molybdate transport system regulatory protein
MARARLSVDLASGLRIGPGKISLLETIRSTGSISAAAGTLEMSYRKAWLLVDEINDGLHEPAVMAESGGRHGGGAVVTAVGARIIDLYHSIEAQAISAADNEFRALGALARRETSVCMTGSR